MITRSYKLILILCVNLGFAANGWAEAIYKYEDKDGNVHFTDTPPDNGVVEEYTPKPLFILQHEPMMSKATYRHLLSKNQLVPMIQSLCKKHSLDPDLVEAIIKAESDFDSGAVSPKGAQGLMQLMPKTASSLGVKDAFNAKDNLEGGIQHFKSLMVKYKDNIELALAAYNAGETAVEKHKGVPPFSETTDYIQKIKKYYSQFSLRSSN